MKTFVKTFQKSVTKPGFYLAGVPGSEALLLDAGRLRSEGGGPNRDLANPGIEEVYVAEFMVEAGDMAAVEVEDP